MFKEATGTGLEDLLLKTGNLKVATDWAAGGQSLVYLEVDPKTKSDLWCSNWGAAEAHAAAAGGVQLGPGGGCAGRKLDRLQLGSSRKE